ncbi:hypothetical protein N7527_007331 [Penicillium freii]|nr:hypothetical protein N7527_007331 [Penicillium freii]
MTTRYDTNAGRNIRADSPSPPSSRRANKLTSMNLIPNSPFTLLVGPKTTGHWVCLHESVVIDLSNFPDGHYL